MSGKPDIISSSSLLLKMEIKLLGISSWKPSKKAFSCCSMSFAMRT